MIQIAESEAREIASALRTGAVPASGLHHLATGVDALMRVVEEELEEVARGEGSGRAKWVRGAYGTGKTFFTRLLSARARDLGFATAEVQISINDTPLHHLETVYRRLVERLHTAADGTGALRAVVDGWLFHVGEEVTELKGIAEDDPAFASEVDARLEDKLAELSNRHPAFAQVLRAYSAALQRDALGEAQQLLGWLGGQPHVDRSILSKAGVRGAVDGQAALAFLRGLLLLLRQSGHAGLVVVLDEVETVQRMPAPTREKALNALRQLVDMLVQGEFPGLYLVVTGTPELFEGPKGVKALQPLYQRVQTRFDADARFDNLRAPQVRLSPFSAERLLEVGRKVRALYPARSDGQRVRGTVDDAFLQALVQSVTQGFGGQVAVAPRLFLRELVDVLDRVDQFPEFEPREHYRLEIEAEGLRPEELEAFRGGSDGASDATKASVRRLEG